jgi:hypothetical protein
MKQIKLPGFAPPPVSRCRVCGRRLTDAESISAGIGPKCKAAEDAKEEAYLKEISGFNIITGRDINRLLGIIERLKQ